VTQNQLPEYIIEAICDDPRHARGKVANLAAFGRFTSPNGEVRWLIRDDTGNWRYTRPDPRGFTAATTQTPTKAAPTCGRASCARAPCGSARTRCSSCSKTPTADC
jgi:hypothetical protein